MNERVLRFRIGVVAVAAVTIGVILVVMFGEGRSLFRKTKTIKVNFPQAPNVTVDTPVRKSGVLIGRVSGVELLDEGGVDLTLRLEDRYQVRKNEMCRIGTGSLVTNDAVIEFVPATTHELIAGFDRDGDGKLSREEREAGQEPIANGDYLENGTIAGDPLLAFTSVAEHLPAAAKSVEDAGEQIRILAEELAKVLGRNEGQLKELLTNANGALAQLDRTLASIEGLVGDPDLKRSAQQAIEAFPKLVEDARSTLEAVQGTIDQFGKTAKRVEDNMANLEGFTQPLGERGPDLVLKVENLVANLDSTVEQIADFSLSLNNREGTLGQLVHNRELYDDVRHALHTVDELTWRLKPVLEDVRVFTSKLARDPGGEIGARSLLYPKPPGTGLKTGTGQRSH